jgi:hypothetical protein
MKNRAKRNFSSHAAMFSLMAGKAEKRRRRFSAAC